MPVFFFAQTYANEVTFDLLRSDPPETTAVRSVARETAAASAREMNFKQYDIKR